MIFQSHSFAQRYLVSSTKMLKLTLVVAAVMLHVVASNPLDVSVEVTVNGVKIPIGHKPGDKTEPEQNKTAPFEKGFFPDQRFFRTKRVFFRT